LHATSRLFDHPTASPVEITRQATEEVALTRRFPNGGLTALQMATAVRRAGLEPEVVQIATRGYLQALVHAYASAGVPLPLICRMFLLPEGAALRHYDEADPLGGHAVTVSGFHAGAPLVAHVQGMWLRCNGITRLFVHDDQVGPFVPMDLMTVEAERIPDSVWPYPDLLLSSAWSAPERHSLVVFGAEMLLLPLYHKIRIDFPTLLKRVQDLDKRIEQIRLGDNGTPVLSERLSWDLRLMKESALKAYVRRAAHIHGDTRYAFLRKALPRFVWSATAYHGDQPVLEYLFDATDLDQGSFDLGTIVHSWPHVNALIGA
jgi:hypothetical protein